MSKSIFHFPDGLADVRADDYDPDTGYRNRSREWWVQAETVVGCLNQYRLSGATVWKTRALAEWNFIRRNIICPEGEWFWGAIPDGDRIQTGCDQLS